MYVEIEPRRSELRFDRAHESIDLPRCGLIERIFH